MKGVEVVTWQDELVRHLARHGSYFTFCSAEISPLHVKRFPLYKMKNDAPTCLRCVGRAICGARA